MNFFKKDLAIESKNSILYILTTFLTQFGSFIIVPLFWKELSLTDYGLISIVEILGLSLGVFMGLNLDYGLTRFYYEWEHENRKKNMGNLCLISWISILLLGSFFIFILSITFKFLYNDIAFYPLIYIGLLYSLFNKFQTYVFSALRIMKKVKLYSLFALSSFFIQISLNIYFVLFKKQGLYGYLISNLYTSIIIFIGCFFIMYKISKVELSFDNFKKLKLEIYFSLFQIKANILSTCNNVLDKFLLKAFTNLEILGIYTISLKFANLILSLHNAIKMTYVPYITEKISINKNSGIIHLRKIRLLYVNVLLLFSFLISFFIEDFVRIINEPEYFQIIFWVPFLVGCSLVSSLVIYITPGLFLSKRSDLAWIPSFFQLIVTIIFSILLIPSLGMYGIVITKFCAALTLLLINMYFTNKLFYIKTDFILFVFPVLIFSSFLIIFSNFTFENIIFSISSKFFITLTLIPLFFYLKRKVFKI